MPGREGMLAVQWYAFYLVYDHFFHFQAYGAQFLGEDHPFQEVGEYRADDDACNDRHQVLAVPEQAVHHHGNIDEPITQVGHVLEEIIQLRVVKAVDQDERILLSIDQQKEGKDHDKGNAGDNRYAEVVVPCMTLKFHCCRKYTVGQATC